MIATKTDPTERTVYDAPGLVNHWVAYEPGEGWVMFPAIRDGWGQRYPYRGHTSHLRPVPPIQLMGTGYLRP